MCTAHADLSMYICVNQDNYYDQLYNCYPCVAANQQIRNPTHIDICLPWTYTLAHESNAHANWNQYTPGSNHTSPCEDIYTIIM